MTKYIFILMVFIIACDGPVKRTEIDSCENEFRSIYLIDTFVNDLILDTANLLTTAEFHPIYIGIRKDSLLLRYGSENINSRTNNWNINDVPDSNAIQIYVDTTRIIGSVNKSLVPPPPPNYDGKGFGNNIDRRFKRGQTKSYPLFIKNVSEDTLNVVYGEHIPLIIEAKDNSGNWKPIQRNYNYRHGAGSMNYYLLRDEILLTSCKLYDGDYETEMRVVFGFHRVKKSNVFRGRMNYEQFIQ